MARRDVGEVARELRGIYAAPTAEAAFDALAAFAASLWGRKYSQAAWVWEDAGDSFTPFLAFSPAVRNLLLAGGAPRSDTALWLKTCLSDAGMSERGLRLSCATW